MNNDKIVVCGGGGFIGGHLVGELLKNGHKHVRCVDVKPTTEWYQVHPGAENIVADLAAFDFDNESRPATQAASASFGSQAQFRATRRTS